MNARQVPEFMHYDDPPPPPWWRELLTNLRNDLAYALAITAALAAALYTTAAIQGVL